MEEELKIWKMGPDFGDIFDPGEVVSNVDATGNRCLILPGCSSIVDVGLLDNQRTGIEYWKAGECIQFHAIVRGVEVWIQEFNGRMSVYSDPSFKVAFGPQPDPDCEMLSVWEASALLQKTIPPQEYVRVTPEEVREEVARRRRERE